MVQRSYVTSISLRDNWH